MNGEKSGGEERRGYDGKEGMERNGQEGIGWDGRDGHEGI